MNDPVAIGSLEGRLCGQLAAALVNRLTQDGGRIRPGRKGMGFSHEFQTDLEATHLVLEQAGLLWPVEQEDGSSISHEFAMNAEDMPDYLASRIMPGDARIEQFLEAFVGTACGLGLSDETEWFSPAAMWSDAMRYLTLAGYAVRDGDRYRWTDRIGQAMRAAHLWDDDCRSLTSIRNAALDQEAYLAWRNMPGGLREGLASRRMTLAEFAGVLALRWRDGRWHDDDGHQPVRFRGGHMALVRRVFAMSIGNDPAP